MENKQWLELIDGNVDEIIEAGEQAFKDSVDNKHLEFIVELYKDGSINVWHDIAGGNSFSSANYKGDSVVIMKFCNQYLDVQNQEDETEEEWLEWYKDEYAYQEASDKLEATIDEMRMDY